MILSKKHEAYTFNSLLNSFSFILLITLIIVINTLIGKGRKMIYDPIAEENSNIKIDPKLYQHPLDSVNLHKHNQI